MTKDKSIFIRNIYYMLAYAFDSLGKPECENLEKEKFENIYDLFAFVLSVEISFLLKKGLYREYIKRQENLFTVRGKIDMPNTIHNKMARKQTLFCEFDELSENNLLNQILKTTAMFLIRGDEVDGEYKNRLKSEMHFFANVDMLEPAFIKWKSVHFQRNNRSYQWPINLCKMVIEGKLLTTEHGDYELASLLNERKMSELYEKFILNYYKRHRHDLDPDASEVPWALDDDSKDNLPVMKTDVHLKKRDAIFIIDAKYYSKTMLKHYDKDSVRSAHLYQIFAYVKNCQLRNPDYKVSGMLLYAKTDEDVHPDSIYRMSGNKISVQTLDLNIPFDKISERLNEIADDFLPCDNEN